MTDATKKTEPIYQVSETTLAQTPILTEEDEIASSPTHLQIKQKWFKYLKNTGRGFEISNDQGFMLNVNTNSASRHRTIEDGQGNLLLSLDRHWTSFKKGWELRRGTSDIVIMNVSYNPFANLHAILTVEFTDAYKNGPEREFQDLQETPDISIKSIDLYGKHVEVEMNQKTIMRMECTNMPPGILSGWQVSPPKWEVDIAEGTDLTLAAVLAVCVSDAYSEARIFMA